MSGKTRLMTGGGTKMQDRGLDLYETPPMAVRALLRHVRLPKGVWEPACGPGAIVEVLRDSGRTVVATDLVDYGLQGSTAGVDFLMETKAPPGVKCIVTNPPYKLADQFLRRAVTLVPKTYVLLRLAYLEGAGRSDLIDGHLQRVLIGKERLPMMHRDGWSGPKISTGAIPFAWFVFSSKANDRPIRAERISWRD